MSEDKPVKKLPKGEIKIIEERCKECGFCIEFCPTKVLKKSAHFNSKGYYPAVLSETEDKHCIGCGLCEDLCPDFAIFVIKKKPREEAKECLQ